MNRNHFQHANYSGFRSDLDLGELTPGPDRAKTPVVGKVFTVG
jgi:hypothetical protein